MNIIDPKNYVNKRKEFTTKYSIDTPSVEELFATLEKEIHGTLNVKNYIKQILQPLKSKKITLKQKETILMFAFNRIFRNSYDTYITNIKAQTLQEDKTFRYGSVNRS